MPLKGAVEQRLTFQEAMSLAPLPDGAQNGRIKRYMSQRKAWSPEDDASVTNKTAVPEQEQGKRKTAYGGHVFSQAGLTASRTLAEMYTSQTSVSQKTLGVHTIHGYFSEAAFIDRPFIYDVTTLGANPSFHNILVTARQPLSPSTNKARDHFPPADAELPLGRVCFSAMVSFRPSVVSQAVAQEPSVQARFADILSSRSPSAWDPVPHIDIAGLVAASPVQKPGTFPAVDIKKVDLSAFNEGKPLHERRELLLYRLLAPLPADDPNVHILTHAFEADRNGLLMIGNHIGYGYDFGRAATLSYSFVVHVNPEDAMMSYGENEWWIEEACFPRVEAGRGIIMSKIWSPAGVHVATEYQDGIIQRQWKPGERQGKL
ncbi:Thioesterase/thiol ester dehydrase-isomerase [Hypoxylon crocopeplum]|nr:Thioesterase/thiol ester dehydrase-isomerase [Hypoxylon crocopeplum]